MTKYEIFKSLHLFAAFAWMVGMFYLPRLYVYHTEYGKNSEINNLFQIMERRLLRGITNPSMIATFIFGIFLVFELGVENLGYWFHVKLLAVLGLATMHGFLSKWRKSFIEGKNPHSSKFYRIINELPTVLLLIIIFMVIGKPA